MNMQTLGYETSVKSTWSGQRFMRTCVVNGLFVFGAYLLLSILLLFVVPQFRESFKDFRTSLPALTELTLNLANAYGQYFSWVPAFFAAAVTTVGIAWLSLVNERAARWTRRGILALLVFILIVMLLGLMLPLVKLIQSVSGGAGGTP